MSKKIYKYKLEITDKQILNLPIGYKILTVQAQFKELCMWVLVDPEETKTNMVALEVHGTGNPIDGYYSREYIATCQIDAIVLHVFRIC